MNKDMGLLDLIYVIAKSRSLVILITLIFAVGAVIYSVVTPEYWKSEAKILPITESGAISTIGGSIADMLGGGFLRTQKSEMAVEFIAVMLSRQFREPVIREFDLINYFKITDKEPQKSLEIALRKMSGNMVDIVFDQESNLITISIETRDKQLSKDIADYYVNALQTHNLQNRMSRGKLNREFLEKQVIKNHTDIDSLALALKLFQEKHQTIALDQQTQNLITLYSNSVAAYFQSEIELELAKANYSENSPVLQELKRKNELLASQIKSLERSGSDLMPKYIVQIDKIPAIGLRYAQLMLNLEIKKKVFELLYPQYELAKLEELKDMPVFEVLDSPQIAGIRSRPKRALTVIVITFAAFILVCLMAVVKERIFVQNRESVSKIFRTLRHGIKDNGS